ncbi:hypothetical protein [Primorskyibacter sp. S187A]|uniref:hypothetical protein n=1 Tax=Primorskyibacter sp. S187A TaxID=3415130 RepID=UPI003C7EAFD0
MATSAPQTFLVGCQPNQVEVTIAEDDGNLFVRLVAATPEITDIDALFFDVTDPTILDGLTVFPTGPEADITSFDTGDDSFSSLSNGATLQTDHDVRIQFGEQVNPSDSDLDTTALTLFIEAGDRPLTADDLDLSELTVVINADYGQGLALTIPENTDDEGEDGGDGPTTVLTEVVAVEEDFETANSAGAVESIADADGWDLRDGALFTNSHNEGTLTLEPVETEGPAALFLDASVGDLHRFEASGHYADSLRIEVQVDGGDWVLLDEFVVNGDKSALVGSETGQTITESNSSLAYDGGVLADAGESVQFRIVSDFTARDETLRIENLAITATDEVEITDGGDGPVEIVTTEVFSEDFDGMDTPGMSDLIADDGRWDVRHDQLFTNSHNEGTLTFEAVETEGATSLSFDASTDNASRFENAGRFEDSFRVEVRLDGGDWVLLDEFQVNNDGSALVGSETGQTITSDASTITYEGGILEDAEGTVEYRFINDATGGNEIIRIDNVEISTTNVEIIDGGEEEDGPYSESFIDASAGDVASDQFDGVTISGQRAGEDDSSENDAMIFNTNAPTGGDHDLAYTDQDNVLIISEDNDSSDPDDNAHGGTLSFEFDAPSTVNSLTLLDIEEPGGTIELFDADGALLSSIGIPAAGDNSAQTIDIGIENVAAMDVTLVGSGAVDDLAFDAPPPVIDEEDDAGCDGQYQLIYEDIMADDARDDTNDDGSDDDPSDDQPADDLADLW